MNDNINQAAEPTRPSRKRTVALASAVGVVGLVIGGVAGGAISTASADSGSSGENASYSAHHPGAQDRSEARGPHGSEELLTGTKKTKVEDAVKAKYPDATIERVETDSGSDSEGVYEAHIVDDGTPLVVKLDKDFKITGTQAMGGPGGDCEGRGGPGHGGPGRGGPDGPGGPEGERGSGEEAQPR